VLKKRKEKKRKEKTKNKKTKTNLAVCPVTDFYRNVSSYQKCLIKILNETN